MDKESPPHVREYKSDHRAEPGTARILRADTAPRKDVQMYIKEARNDIPPRALSNVSI